MKLRGKQNSTAIISLIFLLAVGFMFGNQCIVSADTLYYKEDFESLNWNVTTGNSWSDNNWSNADTTSTSYTLAVTSDSGPAGTGDKALVMATNSTTDNSLLYVRKRIPKQTFATPGQEITTVEFDGKFNGYFNLWLAEDAPASGHPTKSAAMFRASGDHMFVWDGSTRIQIWHANANRTFHNIKLVINGTTSKYDLYINNNHIGQYNFHQSATALEYIRFQNMNTGTGGNIVDNFKVYSKILPEARNVIVTGSVRNENILRANYDYFQIKYNDSGHPLDAEAGSIYKWFRVEPDNLNNPIIISGANSKEYTVANEDIGYYIYFEVIPKDASGNEGIPVQSNYAVEPRAPIAKEVEIIIPEQRAVGKTFIGSYVFFDANHDIEEGSTYKWYRAESEDGSFAEISGVASIEYTLTEDDLDKYLKFEVTPYSNDDPKAGAPIRSIAYRGPTTPMAPEAKNVDVIKPEVMTIGANATGKYDYFDLNDDTESGTTFRWLRSDSEIGVFEPIPGSNAITYTFTENDIGKYLKFEVTPRKSVELFEGKATVSKPFKGPDTPTAKNVSIKGKPQVGETLVGMYEYNHEFGYTEAGSGYKWLINGVQVSTDIQYTITSNDIGKNIIFEVTPRTNIIPTTGQSVHSSGEIIKANNQRTYSYSSRGTGSYSPSGAGTNSVSIDSSDTSFKDTEKSFIDTANHWAKSDIEQMYKKGIVKGYDDNSFEPEKNVSRAEFIAIVIRALGLEDTTYTNTFTDVTTNDWYSGIIQTAVIKGLISDDNQVFRPNNPINREEMTKIIVESYKYAGGTIDKDDSLEKFVDNSLISDWAKEYVIIADKLGFIKGFPDSTFAPKGVANRAQAVVIIKRLLEKINN